MIAGVDRLAGWSAAMTARGLAVDAVEHGDFTTSGGAAAATRLIERHPDLDAIFVANDLMAIGVLRGAGRSVPDDIALVGYDNSAVASIMDPPLTTVVNPVAEMARTACLVLLERIVRGRPDRSADDLPAAAGRAVLELTPGTRRGWWSFPSNRETLQLVTVLESVPRDAKIVATGLAPGVFASEGVENVD